MDKKEIHEARKQAFDKLEKQLQESVPAEDRFFYYHSSEDRIVLSHALFWIMSRPMEKKLPSIVTGSVNSNEWFKEISVISPIIVRNVISLWKGIIFFIVSSSFQLSLW